MGLTGKVDVRYAFLLAQLSLAFPRPDDQVDPLSCGTSILAWGRSMRRLWKIRDWPIAAKVSMAPVLAVGLLVCTCMISSANTHALRAALGDVLGTALPSLEEAAELERRIGSIHLMVNKSLAWEGVAFPAEKIKELDESISGELASTLDTVSRTIAGLDARAGEGQNAQAWRALEGALARYKTLAEELVATKRNGLFGAASQVGPLELLHLDLLGKVRGIRTQVSDHTVADVRSLDQMAQRDGSLLVAASLTGALFAAALSYWVIRAIVTPVQQAATAALAIASGKLNVTVTRAGNDEIGELSDALATIALELGRMIRQIKEDAEKVHHAALEIAAGNQDLANRTEQGSAKLQQANSLVSHLAETVVEGAQGARMASEHGTKAHRLSEEGAAAAALTSTEMARIRDHAERIESIVATVDAIAFQTNILALNAAVEAARAGDAGRGFAVVAGEVRTLSRRSAEAAREIRALIAQSMRAVADGVCQVDRMAALAGQIAESIRGASETQIRMAQVSTEQSEEIQRLACAVGEADEKVQQNAALVEQVSATADQMRYLSDSLKESVSRFAV